MANSPVGFPVPQMQEGLDEREALDCFILYLIHWLLHGDGMVRAERWMSIWRSTLSATEVNYAPIEKECLAIKEACTKFYQYLYGKQDVVVYSDHQPLETIFKKPLRFTAVQVHFRRNRIHLRSSDGEPQVPCDQQPLPEQPVIASGADVGNSAETIVPTPNSESPNENSLPPVQTSRYGRPIRPPKRLDLWNWRLERSMVLDVDYYLTLPVHICLWLPFLFILNILTC